MIEIEQRVFPVESQVDRLLSATRRYQDLFGYPPGRVEDWYFPIRETFANDGAFPNKMTDKASTTVDTHVVSIPMGGVADFEWRAINVQGSVIGGIDFSGVINPVIWSNNPTEWVDIAFFSLNGMGPHQSKPIRGALYKGTGLQNAFGVLNATDFGLPFELDEPTFLSRNDSVRVEITCQRETDVNNHLPPFFVDVVLIGVRFYPKRS